MASISDTDPLVLFREFYQRIVRFKQQNRKTELRQYVAAQSGNPEPSDEDVTEFVKARFQQWFEQKLQDIEGFSSQQQHEVRSALYVIASLTDELMIFSVNWPGAEHWSKKSVLEEALFQTSVSGEQIFNDLEALVALPSLNHLQKSMASLYLLALKLGFEGRYRGNPKALEQRREDLLKLVVGDASGLEDRMCPGCYAPPTVVTEQRRLAAIAEFWKYLFFGVLAYLVVGGVGWSLFAGNWYGP